MWLGPAGCGAPGLGGAAVVPQVASVFPLHGRVEATLSQEPSRPHAPWPGHLGFEAPPQSDLTE